MPNDKIVQQAMFCEFMAGRLAQKIEMRESHRTDEGIVPYTIPRGITKEAVLRYIVSLRDELNDLREMILHD